VRPACAVDSTMNGPFNSAELLRVAEKLAHVATALVPTPTPSSFGQIIVHRPHVPRALPSRTQASIPSRRAQAVRQFLSSDTASSPSVLAARGYANHKLHGLPSTPTLTQSSGSVPESDTPYGPSVLRWRLPAPQQASLHPQLTFDPG